MMARTTGKLTLDKAGRVVLPKPLRAKLNLSPGDVREVEAKGDRITLHAIRRTPALQEERRIWVLRSGEKLPVLVTDEAARLVRGERHHAALGRKP